MKTIKKLSIITLSVLTMMVGLTIPVYAASVSPGGSFSGSFNCGVYEGSLYATGSNATITGNVNWCDRGATVTASATAGSAGTATINFVASDLVDTDAGTEVSSGTVVGSSSVTVVAPSTGGGNSSGGGGNSSGGDNSSGGGSTWTDDEDTSIPDDADKVTLPEEKTEDEELLVKSFKLTTNDTKKEEIGVLEATKVDYNYIFKLNKNQRTLVLDVTPLDDEVKLTYEKNIVINDETTDPSVEVIATKGDVTQTYHISLNIPILISTNYTIEDKEYIIEDSDLVDKTMTELGFKREEFKDAKDKTSFVFIKDKLRLQTMRIPGEDETTQWILLDEKNNNPKVVDVYITEDNQVYLIDSVSEDVKKKTIQQESYQENPVFVKKEYLDKSKGIVLDNTQNGWKFDKGVVTYATNSNLEKESIYISDTGSVLKAAVGFDVEDTTHKVWAYIATAVAGITMIGFVTYVLLETNKKKKIKKEPNPNNSK